MPRQGWGAVQEVGGEAPWAEDVRFSRGGFLGRRPSGSLRTPFPPWISLELHLPLAFLTLILSWVEMAPAW